MHNRKIYNDLISLAKSVVQISKIFFNFPSLAELIPLDFKVELTHIIIKYS